MTTVPSSDVEHLLDGFETVETVEDFRERLKLGRPLNVKLGIDPTSPDLHLGFMVVLQKLQRFAEAGHNVTLIIGDFTASIGDPSGRNAMRPPLTADQIEANMQTYREQAGKVLDLDRVKIRYNSEWLGKMNFSDVVRMVSHVTVAQMLERRSRCTSFCIPLRKLPTRLRSNQTSNSAARTNFSICCSAANFSESTVSFLRFAPRCRCSSASPAIER
jgi:tRNA synthetases class I (W and Y)